MIESTDDAPPPAATPEALRLPLAIERQRRRNWCWAALAASLACYYRCGNWTQEAIVRRLLQSEDTATDLPDVAARLADALALVGCYSHWSPGRPAAARMVEHLAAGHPLCLRLRGLRGGSHFAAIVGYADHGRDIQVDDPLHGSSMHNFTSFPNSYRGDTCFWTETYWLHTPV